MHHEHPRIANLTISITTNHNVNKHITSTSSEVVKVGNPWMITVHTFRFLDILPPSWISINASCEFNIVFHDFMMPSLDFSGVFTLD